MKIFVVIGTRPEAVKLAPVVMALRESGAEAKIVLTGQHRDLVAPILDTFALAPDFQFEEQPDPTSLTAMATAYMRQMAALLERQKPQMILVQGDTTSAFACALAGYYARCPVGHIEAGLRTYAIFSPFPEESHRRMIAGLASLHFAPGELGCDALLAEGIAKDSVTVSGNTVIDALHWVLNHKPDPYENSAEPLSSLVQKPFLLMTAHRRENFGERHERYFKMVNEAALAFPELPIVYVRHPNPQVASRVQALLTAPAIHKVPPLGYGHFIHLLRRALFIITDSGGVQEESAYLGKPALVIRESTERKELLGGGNLIIVGADGSRLSEEMRRLATDKAYYAERSKKSNVYGEGKASRIIAQKVMAWPA